MRILCLDDEPLALKMLEAAIREAKSDAEVTAFRKQADLLEDAKQNGCDVAFLDIHMRGMNGVEVAKRLKEINPKMNIIFVTGYKEYALEAHELYCSAFLLKPVGQRKLKKAFENLRKPFLDVAPDFYTKHYQGNDVIGKKIENYRKQRGLSRQEVADLMMVTRQTIHRWEHGERIPDVLTLEKLARILGVELTHLLDEQ